MTILLFPGRHLLLTAFQEQYLRSVVQTPLEALDFLPGTAPASHAPVNTIVFAVTSANHQFTRYNPIPFHIRAIGVDRFARDFGNKFQVNYRIFGIPHYAPSPRFAGHLLKEIWEQTEGDLQLTPDNTVVLTSTLPIARMFQSLGFAVLPAEASCEPVPATPQQILAIMMQAGETWQKLPALAAQVSPKTIDLWHDFPEVPRRLLRLWHDPLLNDAGSLTDTRNYSTYAQAMSNPEVIDLKYRDISRHIVPGRIVDEGCADGALLVRVAADFPDSDLIGIEISGELLSRCHERQRAGEFGGAFVHFHQRNITSPVFEARTIHTTICNSTLHELWSYNDRAATVTAYLREKFQQTVPRGRLLIRDVVGPDNLEESVWMWLADDDGLPWEADAAHEPADLSTMGRFYRFALDFLPHRRAESATPLVPFIVREFGARRYIETTMRLATEFITKKDYVDNWASEMHEEFAFWSFTDWQEALRGARFEVCAASHVYTNDWIVENRWLGKVQLFRHRAGELVPVPYPPTTLVLIAEKPDPAARVTWLSDLANTD